MDVPRPYWVYVLWSESRCQFYTGVTDDVSRRVRDHNAGVSRWTRGKGPWTLVWQQRRETLGEARTLEGLLKRQKGGVGFFRLTGLDPTCFRSSGS